MKQPKGELTQEEWCNPWDGNGFAMRSGFDHDVMMYVVSVSSVSTQVQDMIYHSDFHIAAI